MIGADPVFFLRPHIDEQNKTAGAVDPQAYSEYLRCYANPATVHAVCEDYRAAATIDLEHDAADREKRTQAALLAIWGAKGTAGALYDVLQTWRDKAVDVHGGRIDCGHTLQEERPSEPSRRWRRSSCHDGYHNIGLIQSTLGVCGARSKRARSITMTPHWWMGDGAGPAWQSRARSAAPLVPSCPNRRRHSCVQRLLWWRRRAQLPQWVPPEGPR